MKRETRSGLGAGSQRVMVNQGPKVEEVQKATGRTFKTVPIQEAARKTTAMASAKRSGNEQKSKAVSHDTGAESGHQVDHGDRNDSPGRDRSGPSSGGLWQGGGPGGGHGNGGGGHGKGHG